MVKLLLLQSIVLIMISVICGLLSGQQSALSAMAGGLCYFLPTSATVLVLKLFGKRPEYAAISFVIGEGLRIVLALILMTTLFAFYHQSLQFLPFFFGLLAVSHTVFLVFWKVKSHGQ